MALSSEERKHWESVVGLTRAHPPERRFAESFRRSTILAVADHLAACERLLREVQKAGMFDSGQLGLFSIAVDDLLGPADAF